MTDFISRLVFQARVAEECLFDRDCLSPQGQALGAGMTAFRQMTF
jgi:hypothetical protein